MVAAPVSTIGSLPNRILFLPPHQQFGFLPKTCPASAPLLSVTDSATTMAQAYDPPTTGRLSPSPGGGVWKCALPWMEWGMSHVNRVAFTVYVYMCICVYVYMCI